MKIFPHKPVVRRYHFIAFLFCIVGIGIIVKAVYIMTVKKEFWTEVSDRFVKDSVSIVPSRGNIFSADGQLLATSLPEYKVFMDYVIKDPDSTRCQKFQHEHDSLLECHLDSLCIGLHKILPDKTVGWYKQNILDGQKKKSRHWAIYPRRVSFITYKEISNLPYFKDSKNRSGFHPEIFNDTKKPFGSLASRTIGDLYPGKDSAKSGLQLSFDTLLRGKTGYVHRQKVRNQYLSFVDQPPVEGADIITTIDTKMQDFCEKALVDKLTEINAIEGTVILMEVRTGDIKAIVNMSKCGDGVYRELRNQAVSNLMEPGSVFKPMSFLVAFEDGYIKKTDMVDCCNGLKMMHGRPMKDHNYHRGGYQMLSISECLEQSSNIGVSSIIDKYYYNQPEKFVEGIYKLGIAEDLHLDIPGYTPPRIRKPTKENWSNTALAWMSIGYETQVPPISVLNFYNGIANGGRMMKPRFVTAAKRNGEIIQEYPTEVIREHMCSDKALNSIQDCLEKVVSRGLGRRAGSKHFKVSGKTGTAQVWTAGGFNLNYLVSFAGYYPSDNPLYSCIVCIRKHGLPASGGMQCGPVFHEISEMAMAQAINSDYEQEVDTLHSLVPVVNQGNAGHTHTVLSGLNSAKNINFDETQWNDAISDTQHVPSVIGMGARDALYILEKLGLRTSISGTGVVISQSLPTGHIIKKHERIHLVLKQIDKSKPTQKEPEPCN